MNSESLSGIIRLLIIVVAGLVLSQFITLGLAYAHGFTFEDIQALGSAFLDEVGTGFIRLSLFLGHLFTFIIPSALFSYLYFRRDKWTRLSLNKNVKLKHLGFAIVFLIASYGAVSYSYVVNSWIPLSDWMHGNEDSTARTLERILTMDHFGIFLINIILVALTPAIGEELLFRGLFQKLIEEGTGKGHLAVWIASFAFSFFHLQFEGFLPRLLLGVVLGYSFLWTRNLWIPMILHFINNALPIVSLYFYSEDIAAIDPSQTTSVPWYIGLASLIGGIAVGYFFTTTTRKNEFA